MSVVFILEPFLVYRNQNPPPKRILMTHAVTARRGIVTEMHHQRRAIVEDAHSCVDKQRQFFNNYLGLDSGDVEVKAPTIIPMNMTLKPLLVPAGILASDVLMSLEGLKVDVHSHIHNPDNIICARSPQRSYVVWTPILFNPEEKHVGLKPGVIGGNVTKPQTFLEHILMQIRDVAIQLSRGKTPSTVHLHNTECATICDSIYRGKCVVVGAHDRTVVVRELREPHSAPFAPRLVYL